jgi:hypothetical protein
MKDMEPKISAVVTSAVSNGSGLDMPGVDRELRELWRQALIDEQTTDHAFVSWRVT